MKNTRFATVALFVSLLSITPIFFDVLREIIVNPDTNFRFILELVRDSMVSNRVPMLATFIASLGVLAGMNDAIDLFQNVSNAKNKSVSNNQVNIDDQLLRIDQAKKTLLESLKTIEDLKIATEESKKEANKALLQLANLEDKKGNLQNEVAGLKKLINSDVDAFRQLAGIPTQKDIRRERLWGFAYGIGASLIASMIFLIVSKIFGLV